MLGTSSPSVDKYSLHAYYVPDAVFSPVHCGKQNSSIPALTKTFTLGAGATSDCWSVLSARNPRIRWPYLIPGLHTENTDTPWKLSRSHHRTWTRKSPPPPASSKQSKRKTKMTVYSSLGGPRQVLVTECYTAPKMIGERSNAARREKSWL